MKITCLVFGHEWGRRIVSENLYYQKGGERPGIYIFDGSVKKCKRCPAEKYEGNPKPVAMIGEEELRSLKKLKGVASFDRVPELHSTIQKTQPFPPRPSKTKSHYSRSQ